MDANNNYACPVCNGFLPLEDKACPKCGNPLADYGRLTDVLGDYSPYRAIDDLKMTDGWLDAATKQCPHILFCTSCNFSDVILIKEIPIYH